MADIRYEARYPSAALSLRATRIAQQSSLDVPGGYSSARSGDADLVSSESRRGSVVQPLPSPGRQRRIGGVPGEKEAPALGQQAPGPVRSARTRPAAAGREGGMPDGTLTSSGPLGPARHRESHPASERVRGSRIGATASRKAVAPSAPNPTAASSGFLSAQSGDRLQGPSAVRKKKGHSAKEPRGSLGEANVADHPSTWHRAGGNSHGKVPGGGAGSSGPSSRVATPRLTPAYSGHTHTHHHSHPTHALSEPGTVLRMGRTAAEQPYSNLVASPDPVHPSKTQHVASSGTATAGVTQRLALDSYASNRDGASSGRQGRHLALLEPSGLPLYESPPVEHRHLSQVTGRKIASPRTPQMTHNVMEGVNFQDALNSNSTPLGTAIPLRPAPTTKHNTETGELTSAIALPSTLNRHVGSSSSMTLDGYDISESGMQLNSAAPTAAALRLQEEERILRQQMGLDPPWATRSAVSYRDSDIDVASASSPAITPRFQELYRGGGVLSGGSDRHPPCDSRGESEGAPRAGRGPIVTEEWARNILHKGDEEFLYRSQILRTSVGPEHAKVSDAEWAARQRQVGLLKARQERFGDRLLRVGKAGQLGTQAQNRRAHMDTARHQPSTIGRVPAAQVVLRPPVGRLKTPRDAEAGGRSASTYTVPSTTRSSSGAEVERATDRLAQTEESQSATVTRPIPVEPESDYNGSRGCSQPSFPFSCDRSDSVASSRQTADIKGYRLENLAGRAQLTTMSPEISGSNVARAKRIEEANFKKMRERRQLTFFTPVQPKALRELTLRSPAGRQSGSSGEGAAGRGTRGIRAVPGGLFGGPRRSCAEGPLSAPGVGLDDVHASGHHGGSAEWAATVAPMLPWVSSSAIFAPSSATGARPVLPSSAASTAHNQSAQLLRSAANQQTRHQSSRSPSVGSSRSPSQSRAAGAPPGTATNIFIYAIQDAPGARGSDETSLTSGGREAVVHGAKLAASPNSVSEVTTVMYKRSASGSTLILPSSLYHQATLQHQKQQLLARLGACASPARNVSPPAEADGAGTELSPEHYDVQPRCDSPPGMVDLTASPSPLRGAESHGFYGAGHAGYSPAQSTAAGSGAYDRSPSQVHPPPIELGHTERRSRRSRSESEEPQPTSYAWVPVSIDDVARFAADPLFMLASEENLGRLVVQDAEFSERHQWLTPRHDILIRAAEVRGRRSPPDARGSDGEGHVRGSAATCESHNGTLTERNDQSERAQTPPFKTFGTVRSITELDADDLAVYSLSGVPTASLASSPTITTVSPSQASDSYQRRDPPQSRHDTDREAISSAGQHRRSRHCGSSMTGQPPVQKLSHSAAGGEDRARGVPSLEAIGTARRKDVGEEHASSPNAPPTTVKRQKKSSVNRRYSDVQNSPFTSQEQDMPTPLEGSGSSASLPGARSRTWKWGCSDDLPDASAVPPDGVPREGSREDSAASWNPHDTGKAPKPTCIPKVPQVVEVAETPPMRHIDPARARTRDETHQSGPRGGQKTVPSSEPQRAPTDCQMANHVSRGKTPEVAIPGQFEADGRKKSRSPGTHRLDAQGTPQVQAPLAVDNTTLRTTIVDEDPESRSHSPAPQLSQSSTPTRTPARSSARLVQANISMPPHGVMVSPSTSPSSVTSTTTPQRRVLPKSSIAPQDHWIPGTHGRAVDDATGLDSQGRSRPTSHDTNIKAIDSLSHRTLEVAVSSSLLKFVCLIGPASASGESYPLDAGVDSRPLRAADEKRHACEHLEELRDFVLLQLYEHRGRGLSPLKKQKRSLVVITQPRLASGESGNGLPCFRDLLCDMAGAASTAVEAESTPSDSDANVAEDNDDDVMDDGSNYQQNVKYVLDTFGGFWSSDFHEEGDGRGLSLQAQGNLLLFQGQDRGDEVKDGDTTAE